jgi:sucrose-phosphate synthase
MKTLIETAQSLFATQMDVATPSDAIGRRLAKLDYFLITDIDNTLIGDDNSQLPELLQLLKDYKDHIGFGVATGRTIESTRTYLDTFDVQTPDVIISSVGAEIYYGAKMHYGRGWKTHISAKWDRNKIVNLLEPFPFLTYQEEDTQRPYKISYDMAPGKDRLAAIHDRLLSNKCRYNLIYSHNKHLDILPYRASKGKALRYLSYKWEIPLAHFLVCGDSGNDEEMFRGEPKAIVVGNYSSELEKLKKLRKIYFAEKCCAGGILEGINHYQFVQKSQSKKDK